MAGWLNVDRMRLDVPDGMDAPKSVSPDSGLRIIIGKNNSGKSRFLRAIHAADCVATIYPQNLIKGAKVDEFSRGLADRWLQVQRILSAIRERVEVRWSRQRELHSFGSQPEGYIGQWTRPETGRLQNLAIGSDVRRAIWILYDQEPHLKDVVPKKFNSDIWQDFAELLGRAVTPKPSIYVPTDRHFSQTATIGSVASLASPTSTWATFMVGLRDESPSHRRAWTRARELFTLITEGLDVDFFWAIKLADSSHC